MKEEDLYPAVKRWLETFLRARHRSQIKVFISSRKKLTHLIEEEGLIRNLPPEWVSWEIYIDIVAFMVSEKQTSLAFVECKNKPITLRDLSQIIGYSRVAIPKYSFIIAPQGASDSLKTLFLTYNRNEILCYNFTRGKVLDSIIIAKWNLNTCSIDYDSLITGPANLIGKI